MDMGDLFNASKASIKFFKKAEAASTRSSLVLTALADAYLLINEVILVT